MKDPELMMYRVAIGQILADAGINRETIKDMVQKSIDEKVERQLGAVIQREIASYDFRSEVRTGLKEAIRANVAEMARWIRITATIDELK